jgi:peptidoglycan/LPS O-acetylase OafA/YrhL
MNRIHRLDGIRAIAILLVFARHVGLLHSGWIGVDLFFVLSGFLITGILRRERTSDSYWGSFYLKRACRILPPLLLCFIGAALVTPIPVHRAIWYALFAANIALAAHPKEAGALVVLWSLAVEEHFYLLWPLAVRFLNRQRLIALSIAMLCVEPILRGIATLFAHSFEPIYYLTVFRLDGLAAGALLALAIEHGAVVAWFKKWSGTWAVGLLAVLGASMAIKSFGREQNSISFNSIGYSLLVACCFFIVAYVFFREDSLLSRLLSLRPLVFLGTISYGFYLFHLIVFEAIKKFASAHGIGNSHHLLALPTFAIAVFLSWLSFTAYERPIIRWGHAKAKGLAPNSPSRSHAGEPPWASPAAANSAPSPL